MRNTKVWRLIISLLLLSPFVGGLTWAQISEFEVGGVYHFTNAKHTGYAMGVNSSGEVRGISGINKADYNQLWYVAEKDASGYYRIRNLGHGGYLQAKGMDGEWELVDAATTTDTYLVLGSVNTYNHFRGVNYNGGYGYANLAYEKGSLIVGWSYNGDLGSQWIIEKQTIDEAELNTKLCLLDVEIYRAALSNLFSDAACTSLKKTFANEAAVKADADYLVLPAVLQKMVLKVWSQNWEESNYDGNKSVWESGYAKKYRVQLYEPYNEPEAAAKALGINAHTNLNNPTGIFMNNGDVAFVMVEGEIAEGASLYLASYTGHGKLGGYNDGIELKTGLNVLPYKEDGNNLCINYVVHTFDVSQGKGMNAVIKGRELSNYPDLKIHIEGGHINGYYNKMGDELYGSGDKNADWDYIEARATQTDVTVLGKYITLQFPLNDADTEGNKGLGSYFNELVNIEPVIDEWDKVMLWERLVLGVLDKETIEGNAQKSPYSDKDHVFAYTGDDTDGFGTDYGDYYNVHGLSFGVGGSSYMYGGWDHCGYHYNTMGGVIQNLPTDAGSHWGPGHEIGHQHQGPLNMRGLTEVTNNLFSNVVLWYFGETTSRYNGDNGSLTNVLTQFNAEGTDFFSNNIWAQTIMYYKLFLYYHVLGHNPKFYPRLYEMLRQDPMTIEYDQNGAECLLHFYKKCCLAAGEDLTEFFRAYGFFEVMENRYVGDYSSASYNMTQEQIDAAIAEVKSWKYEENLAVLFINDATGETIQSHKGDNLELYGETTVCAELGSYASYTTSTEPSYTYTISENTITMTGEGGVGFVLLDKGTGEIIGFSDKKTFEISAEAMEALVNGEATIAAMSASGTPVEVETGMTEDEINSVLLAELIEQAEGIMAMVDETGTKVGFYKDSYVTDVNTALTSAQEVYTKIETGAYTAVYNTLKNAIDELKSKEYAKIAMKPGKYTLKNRAYAERFLSMADNGLVTTSTTAEATDAEKWVFESGDASGVYYVKNLNKGVYLGALSQSTTMTATATSIDDAKGFQVVDMGDGRYALTCQDENSQTIHSSANDNYQIVGWNTEASASQWYLTALETEALSTDQLALEELIVQTEDVLNKVADVTTVTECFDLGVNNYYCNAPMTLDWWGDKFAGYQVLFDEDPSTYLHTIYTGADSEDGLDHYLRVDLGENKSASLFTFTYQTRAGNSNQNPTAITVEGSNSADTGYELIAYLTRDADGLVPGAGAVYSSDVLGLSDRSYRYLRFTVTGTMQGDTAGPDDNAETTDVNEENKHVFFVVSEFGVSSAACTVIPMADYNLTSDEVTAAFNALRAAKYTYNTANSAEEYRTAYTTLKTHYDALLKAYEDGLAENLTAKQGELQALIDKTTALMTECGEVTYTPGTLDGKVNLQTKNESDVYWLSTNANEPNEGEIKNLVDDDNSSYFHSAWSYAVGEPHYLQIDMGDDNRLEKFVLNYTNKNNLSSPYPTSVTVSAGNSLDAEFTTLATYDQNNSLPSVASGTWTSPEITSEGYRYIRFIVNASYAYGVGCNPKDSYYCFAMAKFGLTAIGTPASYSAALNANVGEVTEDLLISTWRENESAKRTKQYATTEAQIDQAIARLQAEYDELYEKKNASVAVDKSALEALIAQTNELLDRCGDIDIVQTPVVGEASALTTTENSDFYVSTNADQNTGGGGNDGGGIAALVDNSEETFFHTRWSGTVVDEAHHVQIDLGDANILSDFKFSYTPRSGSPAPTAMTVYGSNDANSFTDVLATITSGLPAHDSGSTYTSDVITSATKYRYLRFVVTASAGPGNAVYGGQYFFGMREFDLYPITSYNSENVANVDPNAGSVTEEQMLDAYNSKEEAVALTNSDCTQEEVTAKTTELHAYYDALLAAYNTKLYPVTLTTDAANPVLYIMKSRRGDAKVVQYLPLEGHKFNISDTNDGSAVQAFYFMEGTERGQVYVHPYAAGGMVLAANNTGNGADKAFAVKMGGATYEQWKFVEATVEEATWYSLQPIGTSTYFSHYGGGENKMGFYSAADDGSYLQFVSTTVEGSAAYNSLKTYYDGLTLSNITGGTAVGFYPEAQATTYNSAYAVATALLNPGTIVETKRILTADELRAGVAKRTIGIKCVQEESFEKWVSEAGGLSETLAANTIFSLEPTTDGQSGSYYLKAMSKGDDGYFQQSGYALGAKESAQAFVPVEAIYQGGSGNTAFGGSNADLSGASDLGNLVRFVLGSEDGTTYLNPGFTAYNSGTGVWTVYNVYEVCYYAETSIEDADYTAAYNALKAANEALELNMPEAGKFYRLVSACTDDYCTGALVYANANNGMQFAKGYDENDSRAIWEFIPTEGGFQLRSLHTGAYAGTFGWGASHTLSSSEADIQIISINGTGQVKLVNGYPMHAQNTDAVIVGYTGEENSASAWHIVEVEDMSAVKFELTIGQYEHAGMYLNYPVTIPEGVVVKYPNDIEVTKAEGGKVMFAQVEDELPACTGVIVEGSQGTYTFYYDTTPAAEITDNLLSGSAYTTYLPGAAGYSYYLFGVKNNLVGFYMAYLEYNEDGTQTVYDENGNAVEGESLNDTDNGTHFRVGANKVYLPYDYSISGAVTMFGFGDTVTDIDGVETDLEHAAIYDLSGRRIERITTSGIYIVNGRKQYVRASQIK